MLATEHATRLLVKIAAIAQATDEAIVAVDAIAAANANHDAQHWLPPIRQALERVRLECAEMRFTARELRESLPSPDVLQPRLL
ncbi:MAG: hypothetical protein HY332_16100 [Chloroflexi bacterium]|nr:hypothetical protein [Chloroflexota bacterium]